MLDVARGRVAVAGGEHVPPDLARHPSEPLQSEACKKRSGRRRGFSRGRGGRLDD